MTVENGRLVCRCRKKLERVRKDTVVENMPIYCKKCKTEYIINFTCGKIEIISETLKKPLTLNECL